MPLVRKSSNEEGSIIAVLPLVVLLVTVTVFIVNMPVLITSADVVLKNGTVLAAKAAANQYEIETESNNDNIELPIIDFQKAKNSFESILAANLELDNNLDPENFSSFVGKPSYTLLIYNGQSKYNSIPPGIVYNYKDGKITENCLNQEGFPGIFTIANEIEVVLDSPGVIAVVEAVPQLISGQNKPCARWAAARLVQDQNNNWKTVLEGSRAI